MTKTEKILEIGNIIIEGVVIAFLSVCALGTIALAIQLAVQHQ